MGSSVGKWVAAVGVAPGVALGSRAAAAPLDGHTVATEAHCAACHITPAIAAPPRTANCTSCHQWVRTVAANPAAREKAMAVFPNWTRYETSVQSYFAVPHLGASFARLDSAWLRAYLANPWDLRPAMPESMVRLGLDSAELDALVDWAAGFRVAAPPTPAPAPANIEAGRKLFTTRGCGACHTFGRQALGPGVAGAPDLRWTRDRMGDDMIAAWVLNPASISAAATMPAMGLSPDEAVAVRDYLVLADPDAGPPSVRPTSTAVTPAPAAPRWADVEARVFGKICVHCHMDPAQNEGRAGPGNAGGFGWDATGLELQTYAGVVAARDAVIAALDRRYLEEGRDHLGPGEVPSDAVRPALPGMPLGQPALPVEDLEMVKRWYAAGAPE